MAMGAKWHPQEQITSTLISLGSIFPAKKPSLAGRQNANAVPPRARLLGLMGVSVLLWAGKKPPVSGG